MPLARADVRGACFAHWPVEVDELDARLPTALVPATRDGTGWVSVIAQRTHAGVRGVPLGYEFPQVTLRTYVVPSDGRSGDESVDSEPVGVYFLHVEADSRFAAVGARLTYDVPFHHADVSHRPGQGAVELRSDGTDGRGTYAASFEPVGKPTVPPRDSLGRWLTERYSYYLAGGRRGETAHVPWTVYDADAEIHENRLFDAADVPAPVGDPVFRYSPGVEIWLTKRP